MSKNEESHLLQLLFDFFSGKAKTRIYTTFLGWMLIFHIDILFIAILIDQSLIYEKTSLLKGEYLWSYINHFGFWGIAIEVARLVAAAIMTYLMIWVIPKNLSQKSYKVELEVEYTLRKMKIDKEEALNEREEVVVKKQLEIIENEKQVAVERARIEETPEEVKWERDYDIFTNTDAFKIFDKIVRIVYEYGGSTRGIPFSPPKPSIIAYLDTDGIISLNQGTIVFTDKGRYFVKRYTAEN